jgi:hypothetical protein
VKGADRSTEIACNNLGAGGDHHVRRRGRRRLFHFVDTDRDPSGYALELTTL